MTRTIPTVDYRLALSNSEEERHRFVQDVGDALKEIGFFALSHHGIPANWSTRPTHNAMHFLTLTSLRNEPTFNPISAINGDTLPSALNTPRTTLLPISRNFGKAVGLTPMMVRFQPTPKTYGQASMLQGSKASQSPSSRKWNNSPNAFSRRARCTLEKRRIGYRRCPSMETRSCE